MSLYKRKIRLKAEHVDCFRKLRLGALMTMFQECCIAHTEELGMGRKMTLDKGLLWVINSESIQIDRLPEYDEEITLLCRPGKTMHFFFPRQFEVIDEKGNTIIKIGALWSLIDIKMRKMIDPSEHGIVIDGENREGDVAPLMFIPPKPLENKVQIKAKYSLVDINGHMNNASYLEFAQDLLEPKELLKIKRVDIVFRKELPLGNTALLSYGKDENKYEFYCENFSMIFTF